MKPCPIGVLVAAMQAISGHNTDPEPPYTTPRYGTGSFAVGLPTTAHMVETVLDIVTATNLKDHAASLSASQQPECSVHGCIASNSNQIIQIHTININDESNVVPGEFTHIGDPQSIISSYDSSATTLHWLWHLQSADGSDAEVNDGVSFDLFKCGNYTVRAYCTTKQQYGSGWMALCWLMFSLRLVLFLLVEGYAANTTIRCQETKARQLSKMMAVADTNDDGQISEAEFVAAYGASNIKDFHHMDLNSDGQLSEEEVQAMEVNFLDYFATRNTYILIGLLYLLDFANLLNPILNPTWVQQGQYSWATKNMQAAELLGFTATKLEMAVVPSVITIVGRTIIGDHDTDMEVFLFQLCVFVAPVILGKAGYGFEIQMWKLHSASLLHNQATIRLRLDGAVLAHVFTATSTVSVS